MNQPTNTTPTEARPTFEGRVLPRPDDEVQDQGLAFDVTTLLHRRGLLGLVGAGAGAVALAACGVSSATSTTGASSTQASSATSDSPSTSTTGSASSSDVTEIPDETAGPYPGDGSNGPDVLEQSGIVRGDIRSSFGSSTTTAEGVPLTIELTVTNLQKNNAPWSGVAVYAWHCDREGRYSMYSEGVTGENYLRGVQVADADGVVRFTSIFPACYTGRWPHVHFEVYETVAGITDSTNAIATSQLAFPKDVCDTVYATAGYEQSVSNLSQLTLESDNVFGDDGGVHQLGTATGDVTSGYTIALTAPVDLSTTPTGGKMGSR
ncbi:intradiol ring-cleavage dioxygenase [Aestuariimicrobium soli]|uniref:intradiol ring-cleavage dioxygenase n=1 Tax=Aestuariimicrobium soli TaxID=2035834 RepID=UPI003EB9710F